VDQRSSGRLLASRALLLVQAIRDGDAGAAERAHAALNALLAHNILEAPAGAPEGWTPDRCFRSRSSPWRTTAA
jgi:hypothetical protein